MNYIISVCRPEAAAVFGDICSELCLPLSIKLYGRGTAVQSMLDIFREFESITVSYILLLIFTCF